MTDDSGVRRSNEMGRRAFLGAAAGTPLLAGLQGGAARAGAAVEDTPGLIARSRAPDNLESPFSALDGFLTPTDRFYVRSHFDVPELDPQAWRLRVEGAIERPLTLSLDDLARMPQRSVTATLECAGNSRVFLSPAATGVQWEHGAVGTAEWTGTPLAEVLRRAGVKPGAVDVVLEGADRGEIRAAPRPPGPVAFARSLPLDKALDPDVLLASRMNARPLTPPRGFPLRALVPGWYGMASIKWLSRIVVTDRPFEGYYQTIDYAVWEARDGLPTRVPITAMRLKSAIARPTIQEVIPAGKPYRVRGAAWAGAGEVAKVEVSADAGRTWADVRLLDPPRPYCWRRWEYEWRAPNRAGRHSLLARATDAKGNVQPLERDPNRDNYEINHAIPVPVWVR